ncbi:MAG: helix-turn-helix domain-containing protein, partial [Acidobacteria bacterium]
MDIGATLRHARESRGLTCDDVARTTRIPLRMIAAMEKEDWAKLPGGIFTRGYLRAYAREVGVEGEPLVAQYEAEHAPPPPPPPEAEVVRSSAGESWHITIRWPRWNLEGWSTWAWPALAAALLLGFYATAGRVPDADGTGSGSQEAAGRPSLVLAHNK